MPNQLAPAHHNVYLLTDAIVRNIDQKVLCAHTITVIEEVAEKLLLTTEERELLMAAIDLLAERRDHYSSIIKRIGDNG
jgi:transcriptional regulator CtsR